MAVAEPPLRLPKSNFQHQSTGKMVMIHPTLTTQQIMASSQDRVVLVSDRDSKSKLVADGTMFSIGCKLPEPINRRFRFRNIPLGDLHFIMVFMFQEKKKPSQEVARYRELLLKELTDL
jgi:hypothetical protein